MRSLIIIAGLALGASGSAVEKKFAGIEIEDAFRPYLVANPLLMEVTGAKVIRLAEGKKVIVAVASTALKDGSAKERLRAERVCRTKALASVVAENRGIQVAHTEELKEKTTIVIDEKGETATSVSELIEVTKTKVEGMARDMPVIGRWKSKDGEVFYLAIGVVVDEDGEAVED